MGILTSHWQHIMSNIIMVGTLESRQWNDKMPSFKWHYLQMMWIIPLFPHIKTSPMYEIKLPTINTQKLLTLVQLVQLPMHISILSYNTIFFVFLFKYNLFGNSVLLKMEWKWWIVSIETMTIQQYHYRNCEITARVTLWQYNRCGRNDTI